MSTFLKIVLVEPSLILRSGMSYVLRRLTTFDVQVVETGEPERLEELIAEAAPDVLIINPSLTDEEMLRELQQKSLRLIAFQSVLADARLMQRFDAVVSIYDTAEQIKEKLLQLHGSEAGGKEHDALSAREREIVVCVVKGMTNKQIAEKLCLSLHTVITHRRNIAGKLQIHSPAGLTIYAIVNKLVELSEIKETISDSDQ